MSRDCSIPLAGAKRPGVTTPAPVSAARDRATPRAPAGAAVDRAALWHHVLRIAAPIAALIVFPALAPIVAIALYMSIFTLAHELAHGALGLPRRRNELALAIAGVCIATSGHALRLMHLRHHARPLSAGDLEGRSARMPAWQALASAPRLCILLVVTAWRTATARDRRWQRGEYAALSALATLAITIGPRALQIYLLAAAGAQLLAPFWAGHLPHRAPPWLLAIARLLSSAGSMTMRTLVVHDDHHQRPKLPTYRLTAARRAGYCATEASAVPPSIAGGSTSQLR